METGSSEARNLRYSFEKHFPEDVPLSYVIKILMIDNEDHINNVSPNERFENGRKYISSEYDIRLEKKNRYQYFRKSERVLSLTVEPILVLIMGHHTLSPKISVKCHDPGIRTFFESTGTMDLFDTIDGRNGSDFTVERYSGLLLPGQGFVLCFSANFE